jgi:two-component system NtrC family sensor kinase
MRAVPDGLERPACDVVPAPFASFQRSIAPGRRHVSGRRERMPDQPIPSWNRLSVRLAAVISAITVAIVGCLGFLLIGAERDHVMAEAVKGIVRFSDTIRLSTYHAMLENRNAEAYRTMEAIGQQEGIEKVRIFNKEGRITFSTDRREIDTMVDKRAESCYACHKAGQPLERLTVPSRWRIYEAGDHNRLAMVTPIYNEPSCSNAACHAHPAGKRVLGVVDIAVSLADIDHGLAGVQRRTLLLSGLGILLLAASVTLFMHWDVVRPLSELVIGTERVADGDLAHRIREHRRDEIGKLSQSFNGMTGSLQRTQGDLQALMGSLERQVEERTAALKDAQVQLIQSEKLASLGKLAASVAHEINNPLSGILVYAKLLIRIVQDEALSPARQETCLRHLRLVQRETERCSAIVRNLLDFSRQRPLSLKEVDTGAALLESLSLLENQMALQGIRLQKDLAPGAIAQADYGQLRQAFVNVALNACDAMTKGGTLKVTSRILPQERLIEIAFADTGVGIRPEHLGKILDPFFTTKEKGTGLGLSVVYGIVERHGGKLDIRSRVGTGTTVVIRLPASAAPGAAAV